MNKRLAELKNREGGFTLIELMVVVLIIGILVAIAVPKFLNAQNGAKAKAAQSNARSADAVIQSVVTDKGSYVLGADGTAAGAALTNLQSADPMFTLNEGAASTGPSLIAWQRMAGTSAATTFTSSVVTGVRLAVQGKDNVCYVIDNSTSGGTTYGVAKPSSAGVVPSCVPTVTLTTALNGDVALGWA